MSARCSRRSAASEWFQPASGSGAQKLREPAQEQAEVVGGGGEGGVAAVAVTALEIVEIHAMLGLDVADHGLDGGARLISRRMAAVTRRTWPETQTRNLCG